MSNLTNPHQNPFKAIAEAAIANGTPEDIKKASMILSEIFRWDEVSSQRLMDDLLEEIGDATGIVVIYDNGTYRARYDETPVIRP